MWLNWLLVFDTFMLNTSLQFCSWIYVENICQGYVRRIMKYLVFLPHQDTMYLFFVYCVQRGWCNGQWEEPDDVWHDISHQSCWPDAHWHSVVKDAGRDAPVFWHVRNWWTDDSEVCFRVALTGAWKNSCVCIELCLCMSTVCMQQCRLQMTS